MIEFKNNNEFVMHILHSEDFQRSIDEYRKTANNLLESMGEASFTTIASWFFARGYMMARSEELPNKCDE